MLSLFELVFFGDWEGLLFVRDLCVVTWWDFVCFGIGGLLGFEF